MKGIPHSSTLRNFFDIITQRQDKEERGTGRPGERMEGALMCALSRKRSFSCKSIGAGILYDK